MSDGHGPRAGDGRNIDPGVGTLLGEGADQKAPEDRAGADGSPEFVVWDGTASAQQETYYDRPVIKAPVWIWTVPAYFWVGGAAGAAGVLAEAIEVLGTDEIRPLAHKARVVAGVGVPLGAALLVADLGRPERFLNMMRVFRPTSPMSMGSWILSASGGAFAAAMLFRNKSGPLGSLGRFGGAAGALLGGPLAGYTGVLIANTAVPIWQSTRRSLPGLFAASGTSTAASLLQVIGGSAAEMRTARFFGIAGQAGELAFGELAQRQAAGVEIVARPLHEGVSGTLWKAAKGLTAVALALNLVPGRSRVRDLAAGLAGGLGALATRFAVFHAGRASAHDPRATFENQRQGRGGREVVGRAAVTGPGERRATD